MVDNPLGLHASLDYFNAVWRLTALKLGSSPIPLFAIPSAEVTAKLALGCNTAEEFDSRLSGLAQVLKIAPPKGMSPRMGEHPLAGFVTFLSSKVQD